MYKQTTKDPVVAVVTAAMGAGVVVGFSVSQGQNIFVGLGITAFATSVALIMDKLFFRS